MPDTESIEADDCSLEPAVESSHANTDRIDPDVNPDEVSLEEALDDSEMMETIAKLERKLEALERFPNKPPLQSATPGKRKAREYLAEQREVCKQMLKREIEDYQDEEGWYRTSCWFWGGDEAIQE
jgi:hypothetical protein